MKQLLWDEEARSGPLIPAIEGTAHQLWGYKGRKPQWPHSLLVYPDGSVVTRETPTFGSPTSDMETALVLIGGKDYRFDESDPVYLALVAAGQQFRDV